MVKKGIAVLDKNKKISYCDAINLATKECMSEDNSVFCYGIGVPDHKRIFGTTVDILEEFGAQRCFDAPVSEDSLTGFGLGAAITGSRPILIHIRVDFLLLSMNQLANAVTSYHFGNNDRQSVPLTIRAVIGRGWGQGYQHSKSLFSTFAHLPGLEVYAPVTVSDAYYQTKKAIRSDHPTLLLEHRWLYWNEEKLIGEKDHEDMQSYEIFGSSAELVVLATSWMVVEANLARRVLLERGIDIAVISVSSLTGPMPDHIENLIKKAGKVIIADNDWRYCGFGAELASIIYERYFGYLKKPVVRIGFADDHCPTARHMENEFYCNANDILEAVGRLIDNVIEPVEPETLYSHERRFRGPF